MTIDQFKDLKVDSIPEIVARKLRTEKSLAEEFGLSDTTDEVVATKEGEVENAAKKPTIEEERAADNRANSVDSRLAKMRSIISYATLVTVGDLVSEVRKSERMQPVYVSADENAAGYSQEMIEACAAIDLDVGEKATLFKKAKAIILSHISDVFNGLPVFLNVTKKPETLPTVRTPKSASERKSRKGDLK